MKTTQFAVALASVASLVAAQAPYPPQVSAIQEFLPTSIIAAQPGFATENSPAWATLQVKLHSLIAENEAFFQTYSMGVPGFGGLSALVATQFNTALVTGGGSTTSTSSSSTSTRSSSSTTTTTTTSSSSSTSSTSSTSSSTSSTQSTTPTPTTMSSTTSTTDSTSSSSGLPTITTPVFNAAPTAMPFSVLGAALAGVAGLAVML